MHPCPSGEVPREVLWGVLLWRGSWDPGSLGSGLFGLVMLAVVSLKSRGCAADGQAGPCVLLCSSRVTEKGQKLVALSWCEPVAKLGPPGLRLCWEHPGLLPKTLSWSSK